MGDGYCRRRGRGSIAIRRVEKGEYAQESRKTAKLTVILQSLRTIGDGIAWIDPELYASAIRTIVSETLDAFEASPASVPWQRVELALALLYGFGE